MFFWTLVLAHIIGDFPLQTDAIFRLKTRHPLGVLPHVFICTVMNIIALIPYLRSQNAWIAILFLAVVHTVLDRTKITVTEKIAKDNFLQFFIDQLLHFVSIWIAALWLSKVIDPADFQVTMPWVDRELIIRLSALIFAAFAGVPIIFYAKKYIAQRDDYAMPTKAAVYPAFLKRIPGYFERFLATLSIIWGGWWLLLAVGAFLPRLLINWQDKDRTMLYANIFIGFVISLLCGLFVVFVT